MFCTWCHFFICKKNGKAVEEYQSLGEKGVDMETKQFEIDFLSTYLPEQLSDEEVKKLLMMSWLN